MLAGIHYERKCSGCGTICHPYATGVMELTLKPLDSDQKPVTRYVTEYGCNKCDQLNFFEVDQKHVNYFRDLRLAKQHEFILDPTWECKDCGHDYDSHNLAMCLGANEVDGKPVQNCKCFKFTFIKTRKSSK